MVTVRIRHRTTYRYRRPVSLGPRRLRLRPRESRDLTLISSEIAVTPTGTLTWAQDVFGNSVATVVFPVLTDSLTIEAVTQLELHASAWPIFDIAASAIDHPFRHSDDEWTDLGALSNYQYVDSQGRLRAWARGFVSGARTDTLSLLKDLNAGVSQTIGYQTQDDEGTQSPVQTLERGRGSCRDFAVLFAEAACSLGFGVRIVSGYFFNPDQTLFGAADAGSTHAWAEVFVSGAGWISFDPTNRSVGGFNLVPVGVARDIGQIMPVVGSFVGAADGLSGHVGRSRDQFLSRADSTSDLVAQITMKRVVSESNRNAPGSLFVSSSRAEDSGSRASSFQLRRQTEWVEGMTHAALAPGIGREFDPFLFASIGEGRHGHPLTVISALAQSGVDPWLEAIGLARLSRELATARLSRLIAALPGLPASNRPADSIAQELVALLPRTDRFTPSSQATPTPPPTAVIMMSPNARFGLATVVLAFLIAIALLFSTHTLPGAGQDSQSVSADDRDPANLKPGLSNHRP